jgi:hypothetical protein
MSPERFRRIEELYHAARDGTPAERAALLAQTDPETRHELESLLRQLSEGEFLDRAGELSGAVRKSETVTLSYPVEPVADGFLG